ncbi:MAG: hypothetical protein IPM89_08280 [Candidatus Competibacteraceae bacterium]|nr:MAG: hypothetical protein IPM89_08280 [Candidatus Competibacteraceae bacterium]
MILIGSLMVLMEPNNDHEKGHNTMQPARQKHRCKCPHHFDDLTGTVLAGYHRPPWVWVLMFVFYGVEAIHRSALARKTTTLPGHHFQLIHNTRQRDKNLLKPLMTTFLA